MTLLLMLAFGGALAVQDAAQAPRDAFHVACGERLCRLQNLYAEFEVTRGDVRVQRILGHGPGDRLRLRLTQDGDARTVPLVPGRSVGNLVATLNGARRLYVEECRPREGDRSPTADPCWINLDGLEAAVENARVRLTVARRRW